MGGDQAPSIRRRSGTTLADKTASSLVARYGVTTDCLILPCPRRWTTAGPEPSEYRHERLRALEAPHRESSSQKRWLRSVQESGLRIWLPASMTRSWLIRIVDSSTATQFDTRHDKIGIDGNRAAVPIASEDKTGAPDLTIAQRTARGWAAAKLNLRFMILCIQQQNAFCAPQRVEQVIDHGG